MITDIANHIEAAMRTVLQHATWTEERDVLYGDANGHFIVSDPIHEREVYWHSLSTEDQEVGIAILDGDCNLLYQENVAYAANPPRITIGYPPRSTLLHVKGIAKTQEGNAAQGPLTQTEQFIARVSNPFITNIIDFHVRPTEPVSTSIFVEAGMYEKPSAPGVKQRWLGGVLDLSAAIAALTSGQHQLAVVYFDTEAGVLGYSTTTAVSAVGGLPARADLDSISAITLLAGQQAVGTIYLYYGQTDIETTDCLTTLDPRLSWPPLNGVNTDATGITYTPTTSGDWTVPPTTVQEALDDLAAGVVGGSGTVAKRATMWHDESLLVAGTAFTRNSVDATQSYATRSFQSGALNDEFSNSFVLIAGTYALFVLGQKNNSSGILTVSIDGVSQGTLDWYSAGGAVNFTQSLSVTVVGTGYHKLGGKLASKNGSSSGYQMILTKFWLEPSAD